MGRAREYHVLRTQISVGDLFLGCIIDNLDTLRILNNKSDADLIFHPSRHRKFNHTGVELLVEAVKKTSGFFLADDVSSLVKGKFEISAGKHELQRFFINKSKTIQVMEDEADYKTAVGCSPDLRRRLDKFNPNPVYIITGLSICGSKSIEIIAGKSFKVGAMGRADAGPVSIGAGLQSANDSEVLQRSTDTGSAIFAIRVTQLTYEWKCLGENKLTGKRYTHGAEMAGGRELQAEEGDFEVTVGGDLVGGSEDDGAGDSFGPIWIV